MITNFISVKSIIDKLYTDLDINKELNELSVVSWVNEALLKIGAYSQFKEFKQCLELTDGKACLPNGFYRLIDIMYDNKPLHWATNTMASNYGCDGCSIPKCCTEHTFYIENNYLITDIRSVNTCDTCNDKSKVCIAYLGMLVDDEGYPMIPDDVYFQEACASYVTYRLDYQDWRKGQIPDKVFQKSEQDWLFYVNSARGAANMPSIAQLENLKNVMVRLIPKMNEYNNFFVNNSQQERRFRY
jgi:hypothetical protein